MQHAHRLQGASCQFLPLRQRQGALLLEQFGERLSRVFAHQVIQVLALRRRVYFGKAAPGDSAQEPLFQQQALAGFRFIMTAGWEGLEQPGLLLRVPDPIEQRLAALSQKAFDLPALEPLAGLEQRRQRPLLQLEQGIAEAVFPGLLDPDQQGTGVILAAGQVRGVDQRGDRIVGLWLFAQDRCNRRIAQPSLSSTKLSPWRSSPSR